MTSAGENTPRLIAVGGGKGGIGKSLCSANMAMGLARAGHRVVVVDADLGGANLHTCLGVPPPLRTLGDFLNRRVQTLEEVLVQAPVPGLALLAGASDLLESGNPSHAQRMRLVRHLLKLPADYVLMDLGAGTSHVTMDFFLLADHGVLVVIPEPTSVENAYRFIKAAYLRRFKTVQKVYDVAEVIDEAVKHRSQAGIRTPMDLVNAVKARNPEAGEALESEMARMRVRLVVNQVREPADHRVGDQLRLACQRYFGLGVDYLGAIPHDEQAWRSVRARQALSLAAPDSPAAQAIQGVVERLLALDRAGSQAA